MNVKNFVRRENQNFVRYLLIYEHFKFQFLKTQKLCFFKITIWNNYHLIAIFAKGIVRNTKFRLQTIAKRRLCAKFQLLKFDFRFSSPLKFLKNVQKLPFFNWLKKLIENQFGPNNIHHTCHRFIHNLWRKEELKINYV
jgi:hypothetical protein